MPPSAVGRHWLTGSAQDAAGHFLLFAAFVVVLAVPGLALAAVVGRVKRMQKAKLLEVVPVE